MAFVVTNDSLQVMAQEAVAALAPAVIPMAGLGVSLSADAVDFGDTAKVPVYQSATATDYNASSNNYATADDGGVIFKNVVLDKHGKHTDFYDRKKASKLDPMLLGRAAGNSVAKKFLLDMAATITSGNFSLVGLTKASASITADDLATIRKVCSVNDFGFGRKLYVNSDVFESLLKDGAFQDSGAAGNSDALRLGRIGMASGMDVVEIPYLATPAVGNGYLSGWATDGSGLLLATGTLAPDAEVDSMLETEDYVTATHESGLTLGVYAMREKSTRNIYITTEIVYGFGTSGRGLARVVTQ